MELASLFITTFMNL